jgi:hypothetical protein
VPWIFKKRKSSLVIPKKEMIKLKFFSRENCLPSLPPVQCFCINVTISFFSGTTPRWTDGGEGDRKKELISDKEEPSSQLVRFSDWYCI